MQFTARCISVAIIVLSLGPWSRVLPGVDENEQHKTADPLVCITAMNDADSVAQGFRIELLNPYADQAIVVPIHSDISDDIKISLLDREGYPVSKKKKSLRIVESADPKARGYRYQVIAPRTSLVLYVRAPDSILDRSQNAADEVKTVPTPSGVYTVKFYSAFHYAKLEKGADVFVENTAQPVAMTRIAELQPNSIVVKLDASKQASDFHGFTESWIRGATVQK